MGFDCLQAKGEILIVGFGETRSPFLLLLCSILTLWIGSMIFGHD